MMRNSEFSTTGTVSELQLDSKCDWKIDELNPSFLTPKSALFPVKCST